jgi:hypothetical protein
MVHYSRNENPPVMAGLRSIYLFPDVGGGRLSGTGHGGEAGFVIGFFRI